MKLNQRLLFTTLLVTLPEGVYCQDDLKDALQHLEEGVEVPRSIFAWSFHERHCEDNAVVGSWCDEAVTDGVKKCAINPDFDEYGCSCPGNAAACPTECVGGGEPHARSHFEVLCLGIPADQPNYILKEGRKHINDDTEHCENNAVVASWCDEYVNPGLKCSLLPKNDEYVCRCSGNMAACPTDCVGGLKPLNHDVTMSKYEVHCKGIPVDEPNYDLVS
jgi:hypothetical protein